jgi:hypothetical protein
VQQAGLILSGYKGIAIWFLPLPLQDYGPKTVFYRQAELTGTKFTSIWKTDLLIVPFIIVCGIVFAQFIWSMGPIPSSNYPYADMMWELQAKNDLVTYSATTGGYSQFMDAFKPLVILIGVIVGLAAFVSLKALAAPTLLMYGAVRGIGSWPHYIVLELLGALVGRFVFEKRLGQKWRQYAPVLSAGYFCGAGLVTMFAIGVMFLAKAIFKTQY